MFLAIKWDSTYLCNLNCIHCLNAPRRQRKKDISETQMERLVNKLAGIPLLRRIQILGGEPTARSDFDTMVKTLSKAGILVGVNSNGVKSKTLENVIVYLEELNISIESHIKEIHESIRGRRTFDKVTATIKRASDLKRENGLKTRLVLSTVLNRWNIHSLPDMVEFVSGFEIDQWIILQLLQEGNAHLSGTALAPTPREIVDFTIRLAEKLNQNTRLRTGIISRFTRPYVVEWVNKNFCTALQPPVHGCGAGITTAYVNQRGELFPCDRITPEYERCPFAGSITPKSLLDYEFIDIWDSWEFNKAFELQEDTDIYRGYHPCSECEHLRKDCYPCPVYYQEGVRIEDCLEVWRQIHEES